MLTSKLSVSVFGWEWTACVRCDFLMRVIETALYTKEHMMRRWLFFALVLLLSGCAATPSPTELPLPTLIPTPDGPFGVTIMMNDADDPHPTIVSFLTDLIPPEWLPITNNAARYEAHIVVSSQTSVCEYWNFRDLNLTLDDVDITLVDTVSGKAWPAHHFEHEPLGCPTEQPFITTSSLNKLAI